VFRWVSNFNFLEHMQVFIIGVFFFSLFRTMAQPEYDPQYQLLETHCDENHRGRKLEECLEVG
jgi:hypothetical protein